VITKIISVALLIYPDLGLALSEYKQWRSLRQSYRSGKWGRVTHMYYLSTDRANDNGVL